MDGFITIEFSTEELLELFNRCLSSSLEDTESSVEAMRKVGEALAHVRHPLRLVS